MIKKHRRVTAPIKFFARQHNTFKAQQGVQNAVSPKLSLAVESVDVVKVFGDIHALNKLGFKVKPSEIFGLIGPNGAGKTTALRVVSTLLLPTSGTVRVFSLDVVEEAAEITGLGERLKDKTKGYSKGMKRRLLVARALMTRPRLAVLDEPTSGLDVLHAFHVREIIKRYVKEHGVTVLLSSHNMLEVEHLCDRVALLNKGKIVAEGKPKELKEKFDSANLEEVFAKVVGLA